MNQNILSQIEDTFSQLSISEQLRLIERLVHRVHEQTQKQNADLDTQLAQMAADPQIQVELAKIEEEFSNAEADGLEMN
jgi:capsule polysaccharide export protein KpsE/RkpR